MISWKFLILIGKPHLTIDYGLPTLENVLFVPEIAKSFVSFSKLGKDNNVYIEFHADSYLVKDMCSRKFLL